jgi:TetR/AcrR family transcriptional regulator, lmrAB and yxaGH operons repressor
MARPQTVPDEDLIERLSKAFRTLGYNGASLADLAAATGLSKAGLYHRFPGGKQQMAEEVLAAALQWYEDHIFAPLRSEGSPLKRLQAVARELDGFYDGGRTACLLNILSVAPGEDSPFAEGVQSTFKTLIAVLADFARQAGHSREEAERRAQRTVMSLHGALVLSRGLGSGAPFQSFLDGLSDELVGPRFSAGKTP